MIPRFRVWDRCLKLMRDVSYIDFNNQEVMFFADGYKDNEDYLSLDIYRHFAEVEIMQSTGLKDKTGVEIYEGDILLSTASENQEDWRKWQVHYADGCFQIVYKEIPKDKRRRTNLELEDLCEDNVWFYGLKVIGNIYENPELMKMWKNTKKR